MGWGWCLDNTIVPAMRVAFSIKRCLFLEVTPGEIQQEGRSRSGGARHGPLDGLQLRSLCNWRVFFLLTLATLNAVRNIDRRYLELASFLGAGRMAQIIYVVVPAALPSIFIIMRINFFAAWMAVLTAEGVGVTRGLGALVLMARATANVKLMLAAMTLIAGSGVFIDLLLRVLQKRFLSWHTETLLGI